ncbi:MAG: hypothetical protein J0H92_20755 [Sphingobacteriales bacterium]|nr:hypothetical protein [Sphingobacteriales bacterium]OJW32938.1 MAG: hypothetical protein BGO54_15760 [Sphingobacteriales bacterium 46-32]
MQFQKTDMEFTHYRWEHEPVDFAVALSKEPTRKPFDPHNGMQVLYIINYFLEAAERFSTREARVIESIIAHQLPKDMKSERSVYNWLLQVTQ